MSRRSTVIRLVAVAALGGAAACSDATSPTGAPASVLRAVQAPDLGTLARVVPGFGGLFLDNGVPTVYLTDVSQRGPIERALGPFARGRGFAPAEIRVLQGRYAYGDLDRWFQQVSQEVFAQGGIVFVDLDEATNRVLVGVERGGGASHANVRSLAARLGVPAEAIVTRDVDPIHYAATLRDQVRPVVAGLQIHFGNFLCSIGFNAVSGGQNSFVTASHCTNRQGGTAKTTVYYQPLQSVDPVSIGTEVDDPRYFRGTGCPKGRKCRFSDAARAAYATGVPFTLGGIAQTSGPNNGSIDITGIPFQITAEGAAISGSVANKVGRTTGWTQGNVTLTCVNTGVSGSNIVLLCQDFVENTVPIVGPGDSGSDVFAQSGSGVTLLGVLWGGNAAGTLFVYSPIFNVEQELGPLTTF